MLQAEPEYSRASSPITTECENLSFYFFISFVLVERLANDVVSVCCVQCEIRRFVSCLKFKLHERMKHVDISIKNCICNQTQEVTRRVQTSANFSIMSAR